MVSNFKRSSQALRLNLHVHFSTFIHSFIHSFIHYYFFLSTWRVASSVELTLASVACGSLAGSLLLYFTVLGFCLLVTSFPLFVVSKHK